MLNRPDTTSSDNHQTTALHLAARGGHSVIVKLLLEHNADVNVKGGGCLLEPVLNRSDTISQTYLGKQLLIVQQAMGI